MKDELIGDLVNEIAYKQHHVEQAEDFLEKVWIVKEFFGKHKDEWQDISSAPKDGTYVLVYCPNSFLGDYHVVRWRGATYDTDEGESIYNATHWRPLPNPPEKLK